MSEWCLIRAHRVRLADIARRGGLLRRLRLPWGVRVPDAAWAVLAAGLCFCTAAAWAEPVTGDCALRVAWDPYEPYSYSVGDDSAPVGFDIEVVSKVAGMIGCTLAFERMPWSEILTALRKGETDMTVGTGYKPDRAAWSYYSESYRKEIIGLAIRAGSAREFAGADLAGIFRTGFVFGKTTDDSYSAAAESVFAQYPAQVRGPVSETANLERLLGGEIDGFLIEVNVASALIRKREVADRVEFHPVTLEAGEYRFQMSKKTVPAELVARVNEAIQRLERDGWLNRVNERYGVRQ